MAKRMAGKFVSRVARQRVVCALWLGSAAACSLAPAAVAQMANGAAIRVESNQVVVPVVVVDKRRAARLQNMGAYTVLSEWNSKDFTEWTNIAVPDLVARDFRVFEDGREQKIERVIDNRETFPSSARDNLGQYFEFVGIGGGTWVVPVPSRLSSASADVVVPDLSGYLIAYAPPPSPPGSCHTVSVKVDRPNSLVYARPEYCNTKDIGADPLNGTKVGKKLEKDLLSAKKKGKIKLSLTTFVPFSSTGKAPVRIYAEFPSKPSNWANCAESAKKTISILGAIYAKDGTPAARFSDFASKGPDANFFLGTPESYLPPMSLPCASPEPNRYQTEMLLPPGQYELRMVLRDENKFGRAMARFTVGSRDGMRLAISGIALARRFRKVSPTSVNAATEIPENYAPLITKGVEVIPTADKRFKKSDPFYFYFQVYESQQTSSTVKALLRIVNAKTGTVMRLIGPFNVAPYSTPGDPVIPIGGGIDVNDLPPGSYRLEARATDSKGQSTNWQTTNFTID